jgi:poly-gamma-glutamate capsule biosynthesis protein CapA/YwtB (metallophosphatase superfamily)
LGAKIVIVLIVLTLAYCTVGNMVIGMKADGVAREEAKAKADHAAALENARRARCATNLPTTIEAARAGMAEGKPEIALAKLFGCDLPSTATPEVLALLGQARAAKTKADETAKIARAKADAAAKLVADAADRKAAAELKAFKKKNGVAIGMSAQDVLDSSWGRPESVNRTTTANGIHEQWVYSGSSNFLYFENGVLTAIQN